MKKTILSLLCLLVTSGLVRAQLIGSDFTDHVINPGFEEGVYTPEGTSLRIPEGWTLVYDLPGWIDVWAGPTNDVNCPTYEGVQYLNCWASEITQIDLSQKIKLPVGAYELTAMMRMTNMDAFLLGNQRMYAKVKDKLSESAVLSEKGMGTEWEKLTLYFAVFNEEDSVTIGAFSSSDTRSTRGWFQLDDVRITYYGTPDAMEVTVLQTKISEMNTEMQLMATGEWTTSGGMFLIEKAQEINDEYGVLTDLEELSFALDSLTSMKAEILRCDELSQELLKLIDEESILVNASDPFPGIRELQSAIDVAAMYLGSYGQTPEGNRVYSADLQRAFNELEEADKTYRLTQPASPDNPADYTWIIQYPNFTKKFGDPTDIKDSISAGWVKNNVAVWGDFRVTNISGLNCWNNWSNDFTSMDVYQDLIVPSGIYSVECKTTTDGAVTDNHAYAKSTAGIAVSPAATYWYQEGGNAVLEAKWETLATGKVFVGNDGKLRIGFASTSGRNGSSGWFCITDYVLKYYGTDPSGYEDALAQKIVAAEGMCDSLILGNERAKLKAAIEVGKAAVGKDVATIDAAFAVMNEAMDLVPLSYQALKSYNETQENTLKDLETVLQNESSVELVMSVVGLQNEVIQADTTTYPVAGILKEALHSFNSYIRVYDTAPAFIAQTDVYTTENIQKLENVLAAQVEIIKGSVLDQAALDKLTVECRSAIVALRTSIEPGEDTDFTFMITNPNIDVQGESNRQIPNGWTITQNTGDQVSRGAHYTGDATNTYLDSWSGTAGHLAYTAQQKITDLPNGTYRLTCVTRASGEGAVVFASAKDTLRAEAPLNNDVGGSVWANAPEGSDLKNVNEGRGSGWDEVTIDNIVVWCNSMVIGVSTDPMITQKTWSGYWFSCDEFRLTYLSRDWNVGIEEVNTPDQAVSLNAYANNGYIVVEGEEDYTVTSLSGSPVPAKAQLAPGIYLVKAGMKTAKVMVK